MPVDASRLTTAVQNYAAATMTAVGPLVAERVGADHRVPFDTGEPRRPAGHRDPPLRATIRSEGLTAATGTSYTVRLVAPVIQAATTNFGARPHRIVPRRPGGLLVFNWPRAGGTVFLRSVNHPGNRAMNWWTPALRDAYRTALPRAARTAIF